MRVLLIGGTGFSGPHVVRRLCELGHETAVAHRGRTAADLPAGVQHILCDRRRLEDTADELRRFAPEVVVDMIAATELEARSVVDVFRGVARRVVALSSQDVYRAYGKLVGIERGGEEAVPLSEEAALRRKLYPHRSQATGPRDKLYHYEKILVERVFLGNPQLPGTILRLPMVYGPGDPQHRLFEYVKRMDDGRPAILLNEGMASWRWTRDYVENVADAVALAATDERATGRIYNVGEPEALSTAEWVRRIGVAARWTGTVVVAPEEGPPGHGTSDLNTRQHLVVDTSRIREELHWEGRVSRDEALRRTVSWQRSHPPQEIDPRQFDYAAEDAVLADSSPHEAGSLLAAPLFSPSGMT